MWVCAGLMFGPSISGSMAQQVTNVVKSLTIHECVERALANNLDIRVERVNPGIAQWGVVFEQGAFEPTLAGTAKFAG